jgi:phage shock protein PspC (stress-responsive transcriptional regulator)
VFYNFLVVYVFMLGMHISAYVCMDVCMDASQHNSLQEIVLAAK